MQRINEQRYERDGWLFLSTEGPIWGSADLDSHPLLPGGTAVDKVPDAFFGHNFLTIESGSFRLNFNAQSFLACTRLSRPVERQDHYPNDLKLNAIRVSDAESWTAVYNEMSRSRPDKFEEINPNYDWTFSSLYWGDLGATAAVTELHPAAPSALPSELLMNRSLPILWFAECPLIDDDLGDSGLSTAVVKVRVMPTFWFLLYTLRVRVDRVLFRSVEVRVFHEFGKNEVLREFLYREVSHSELLKRCEDKEGPSFDHMTDEDCRFRAVQTIPLSVAAA